MGFCKRMEGDYLKIIQIFSKCIDTVNMKKKSEETKTRRKGIQIFFFIYLQLHIVFFHLLPPSRKNIVYL